MTAIHKRPLVPEDRNGHRPAKYLERAAFAHALATAAHTAGGSEAGGPEAVAQRRWSDGVTNILLRGAVSPATITDPAWAGILAQQAVGDFVSSLEPLSAGARLLNAAPRVSFDRAATIAFPHRDGPTAPVAHWVVEGEPIPVPRFSLKSAVLGPMKRLAAIAVATREVIESGVGETVLTTLLREACAFELDKKLYSADAATDAAPAGLLNGVAALPGTADALADLSKIAAAVAPFASSLVFIAHPTQASYLALRRGFGVAGGVTVWPTLGVAPGTIIGLDPAALASAFGPEPEIRSSKEVVLHLDDADPLPIGSPGSPPTVAAPAISTWQVDCIATRLVLRAAWVWRAEGAAAWVSDATWGAVEP